jgi:hypothetical protein
MDNCSLWRLLEEGKDKKESIYIQIAVTCKAIQPLYSPHYTINIISYKLPFKLSWTSCSSYKIIRLIKGEINNKIFLNYNINLVLIVLSLYSSFI